MSEMLLPMEEEEWKKPPAEPAGASLMTPLGLIEGEILDYVDAHGATSLRRLIRELAWSAPMVMMGVGALIRQGLVRAMQHDLEVVIHANGRRSHPASHFVVDYT